MEKHNTKSKINKVSSEEASLVDSRHSRGFASISYDRIGLPKKATLDDGKYIAFVYDALGRKLSQTFRSGLSIINPRPILAPESPVNTSSASPTKALDLIRPIGELSRTDYVGPCVYVDRELKRILFPGGYIDADGEELAYRFFINDHQGNVRAVIENQSVKSVFSGQQSQNLKNSVKSAFSGQQTQSPALRHLQTHNYRIFRGVSDFFRIFANNFDHY